MRRYMYWKEKEVELNGVTYQTYKYFKLVQKPNVQALFYNPFDKQINYPIKYELLIDERICRSELDFLEWYNTNKKL